MNELYGPAKNSSFLLNSN